MYSHTDCTAGSAGSGCHGCVEPEFPDALSPLYKKLDEEKLDRFRLDDLPAAK